MLRRFGSVDAGLATIEYAALVVLRDHRDRLRASERARSLYAAGRVEGRLMLVLVLCYLPALMLLVVIPLFLTLLDGLFA